MNAKQRRKQVRKLGQKKPIVEHLEQNNSPFNQAAKKILHKLKVDVSQAHLFGLQLALHGLESMKTEGWMKDFQPAAINQAEQMLAWKPEAVEPWVRYGEEGRRADPEADDQSALWLSEHKNPQEAAEQMGMNLWENLQERVPSLSPPPTE
jgi:hypothetical protein